MFINLLINVNVKVSCEWFCFVYFFFNINFCKWNQELNRFIYSHFILWNYKNKVNVLNWIKSTFCLCKHEIPLLRNTRNIEMRWNETAIPNTTITILCHNLFETFCTHFIEFIVSFWWTNGAAIELCVY